MSTAGLLLSLANSHSSARCRHEVLVMQRDEESGPETAIVTQWCYGLSIGLLNAENVCFVCDSLMPEKKPSGLHGFFHPETKIESLGRSSQIYHHLKITGYHSRQGLLNETSLLGKSPKQRIILTTGKSSSMTAPETSKNQWPCKVGSLTKGQTLWETTGGYLKTVPWGKWHTQRGTSECGFIY